ncbi:MAG: aldehyde dehydrogenase family protein [Gammaproteobacteria bacterium]
MLKVLSPYDEHLIKEIPTQDKKDAEEMLQTAQRLFEDRRHWLPAYQRVKILEQVLYLMQQQETRLATEAAEEGGKPLIDSKVEAARAIQGVKIAIEHLNGHLHGVEIPMGITPSTANRKAFTMREPRGPVCAVSAFNHPLNLIVHQVIPAIATGCPVIVKPASSTPLSCLNLVNILYEAGLPREWCQVLVTNSAVAEKVVCDPRIRFFSFIGSGKVGWYLRAKLAPGTSCTLEHGGAAPVIIEPDADIDAAIPVLVKGGFYHAGQVCVSVQRVYVEQSQANDVANAMAKLASKLIVGDPVDPKTEVGPLIARSEVERVDKWVKEAIKKGAQVLCGAEKISETCYAPTVLLDPPEDVALSQNEIFGPVVCVYSYQDRDEAIRRANQLPFAFQAAVFTRSLDAAFDVVQRLNANTVMVNDHTAFRADWMPFGGRLESGMGVGGIGQTMHEMTFEKLMVLKSLAF